MHVRLAFGDTTPFGRQDSHAWTLLDKIAIDDLPILREDRKEVSLCQLVGQATSEDVSGVLESGMPRP